MLHERLLLSSCLTFFYIHLDMTSNSKREAEWLPASTVTAFATSLVLFSSTGGRSSQCGRTHSPNNVSSYPSKIYSYNNDSEKPVTKRATGKLAFPRSIAGFDAVYELLTLSWSTINCTGLRTLI
jgi:hypothetical protein